MLVNDFIKSGVIKYLENEALSLEVKRLINGETGNSSNQLADEFGKLYGSNLGGISILLNQEKDWNN